MTLADRLGRLPENPRVVVSGNHATPWDLLREVDALLPSYRLWALNGQPGLPDREGVVLETSFVGPGQRRSPSLCYVPSRLSLVPSLFSRRQVPDLVLVHTTPPRDGKVSLGIEVNVLPAAIEAARAHGGAVVAQVNPAMPWTVGDALVDLEDVDLLVEVEGALPASPAALVDDADLRAEVQKAIDDANTLVSQAESIRKFRVLPIDWTEESGHLTPSLKLRRAHVTHLVRDDIDRLYGNE